LRNELDFKLNPAIKYPELLNSPTDESGSTGRD